MKLFDMFMNLYCFFVSCICFCSFYQLLKKFLFVFYLFYFLICVSFDRLYYDYMVIIYGNIYKSLSLRRIIKFVRLSVQGFSKLDLV